MTIYYVKIIISSWLYCCRNWMSCPSGSLSCFINHTDEVKIGINSGALSLKKILLHISQCIKYPLSDDGLNKAGWVSQVWIFCKKPYAKDFEWSLQNDYRSNNIDLNATQCTNILLHIRCSHLSCCVFSCVALLGLHDKNSFTSTQLIFLMMSCLQEKKKKFD